MGLCLHMTSIKIRGNKAEFAISNNLYIPINQKTHSSATRLFVYRQTRSYCIFIPLPMLIHSDNGSYSIYLWRGKTSLYLSLSL